MEDVQRFLRYTIPGLVLIIEVSIYLLFSSHKQFLTLIKDLKTDVAIFTFIASGGIGYFLSTIYHWLYWKWPLKKFVINHISLFQHAIDRDWVKFSNMANGEDITEIFRDKLTQKQAWYFSSVVWLEKLGTSKTFQGATDRIDRLIHIMHSLGITLIGSIMAIFIWLFAHNVLPNDHLTSKLEYLRTFLVMFVIICIHLNHFQNVVKDFQIIIDTVTWDSLQVEFIGAENHPTIINFSPNELEGSKKAVN